MRRCSCLILWLVIFVGSGGVIASEAPSPEAHPTRADSRTLLSRASEREAHRLVLDEPQWPSQVGKPGQPQTRSSLVKCTSKKKGALIGAAVGGMAGGVFGMYLAKGASGVLGTASGAPKVIAYYTIAGGGAGAALGLLYCS